MNMPFPGDVSQWQYKSRFDIEALTDAELLAAYDNLKQGIKLFNEHGLPMTNEMFWQLMSIPVEIQKRTLNK